MTSPLLTIAIPTYNRADYLRAGLAQLAGELDTVEAGAVEVVVSDNCSDDHTPQVVAEAIDAGMPVRSLRNKENLGWAPNFLQCFEEAQGEYVLMMGDDDLLVDGALLTILSVLKECRHGVVFLRPYGFDVDFREELPGSAGTVRVYEDSNEFILAINRWFTLTSALVIRKRILTDRGVDPYEFVTTDLATFHLVLKTALGAESNCFVDSYLVASKRQNSFSYAFEDVFVRQMWAILEAHRDWGLSERTLQKLETIKIGTYYPFYLFDLRRAQRGDPAQAFAVFRERFGHHWLFWLWLAPILRLPRPLALLYGAMATGGGRFVGGDARRGLAFLYHAVRRFLRGERKAPSEGTDGQAAADG